MMQQIITRTNDGPPVEAYVEGLVQDCSIQCVSNGDTAALN